MINRWGLQRERDNRCRLFLYFMGMRNPINRDIDRMTRLSDIVDNATSNDPVQYVTESGGIGWVRPLSYRMACKKVNKIAADLFMKKNKFYQALNEKHIKKVRK